MKRKDNYIKIKKITSFFLILTILITITSTPSFLNSFVKTANAVDIITYSDSNSQIRVSIPGEEPPPPPPPPPPGNTAPRILWYDFQNSNGVSKLNSQIEVDNEYKFIIKISSDQGWDDIDYIDINAWYDNGVETTTYNNSGNLGGNLNMFLRYQNTTGTANYTLLWPKNEVIIGDFLEEDDTDPNGSIGYTECRNLTFFFKPSYQFRYAPGDGNWSNLMSAHNDINSWNFKILVTDSGENASGSSSDSEIDEFGVYSYTEIASTGMPSIEGLPGNLSKPSNVNLTFRSNLQYSLSIDTGKFIHEKHPTANITNQSLWIRGGNITEFINFSGNKPIFIYGSPKIFNDAEDNNSSKIINNMSYKVNVSFGQIPGDYFSTTDYSLRTPLSQS